MTPGLSPWSPTGEIVRYVLEGPGYTPNQLKAVQDWVLNRALKQVPGVIDVTGFGGTVKQYQVLLDTRLLKQYDVTLQQVEDAIARSNANVGGDILTLGTQSHNVRAIGLLGEGIDPLDPANVRAALRDRGREARRHPATSSSPRTTDMPIYVRQVAKVVVGHRPRLGHRRPRRRGRRRRRHRPDAEGREVAADRRSGRRRRSRRSNERQLLPKGMRIVVFNQRTDLVHVTTHNVLHNLVVGMGLVIAVLFIFLGDLASAGIVALVIPLALLFSISVLYVQGKSANLLSIGAVDFGIIVDSSVIIVENIYRHVTAHGADRTPAADRPDRRGLARDRAAALLLDDDHRLRLPPAVLDDRPGGGPVRADGQHLRLRDPRGPARSP